MVSPIVFAAFAVAIFTSFWSSLVEATYLTLRPLSLGASIEERVVGAKKALAIVEEKTKLVSVTTFADTFSNVVLASTMGLILSSIFGPIGWVYSTVIGSFAIMTMLYLLPKAIGIENARRMGIRLAPTSHFVLNVLSPIALPLTAFARALSQKLVGKPTYGNQDLVSEFEEAVGMLEKGGRIEPEAGRMIRTAISSSRLLAKDVLTTTEEIISVSASDSIFNALKKMGETTHQRLPVYDTETKTYVGAVTFRTLSKALGRGLINTNIHDYTIQPARVEKEDSLASVTESMQDAATTIAFVYSDEKLSGVITLSDIIREVIGIKL